MIKTNCADEIRQLVISPNEEFIAILTTHTVHIALLPDSSHLKAHDRDPLKLKMHMLGPTSHVTTQPAIASALWHPLGKNGSCLVTITEESVVRVWELAFTNRMTFEKPTLSIDLKKLIDGSSVDQDFSASKAGVNKGFSADSFDMEVASACFGERDSGGWSSMTLWIAMREGDVYALCPLLPEKWSPTPLLMASLSVSIVAKAALTEQDFDTSDEEKLTSKQQLQWMQDLDMQDPTNGGEEGAETDVYTRPAKPGKIPRLQGPFDIEFQKEEDDDEDDEEDILLSDILVIGAKHDADELMFGEEDSLLSDEAEHEGLSVGVICLLRSSGRVTICLDIDGVEAQWLPQTKPKTYHSFGVAEEPSLIAFQAVEILRAEEVDEESWPMFSTDCSSRYSFFVTSTSSITGISLSPWIFRLESELKGTSSANEGVAVRLGNLVKGPNSTRERIFPPTTEMRKPQRPLAASVILRDPDLGYFLLSASPDGPVMISFDSPELSESLRLHSPTPSPYEQNDSDQDQPLQLYEPRLTYQPPPALGQRSSLPTFLDRLRHSKYKALMHEHVKLSPATLSVMTDTHKVISDESDRIREAAAELFRRCERLQTELRDQIQKANQVAKKVEAVVPTQPNHKDADGEDNGKQLTKKMSSNEIIDDRIERAKEKQKILSERLEGLRLKVVRGNVKELSLREKAWIGEVDELKKSLNIQEKEDESSQPPQNKTKDQTSSSNGGDDDEDDDDEDDDATEDGKGERGQTLLAPYKRFAEIKTLTADLLEATKKLTGENADGEVDVGKQSVGSGSGGNRSPFSRSLVSVPHDVRKAKMQHVNQLLKREESLVMNIKARLDNLSI